MPQAFTFNMVCLKIKRWIVLLEFDYLKSIIKMNYVCSYILQKICLPMVLSVYDWKHYLLSMSKQWFILWVPWSNPSILNNDFYWFNGLTAIFKFHIFGYHNHIIEHLSRRTDTREMRLFPFLQSASYNKILNWTA